MIIPWRIVGWAAAGALAVSAIAGGIAWYGSNKYDAGYTQAELIAKANAAEVSEQYREKEHAAQRESEERYAKYLAEQAKTDASNRRLTATNDGLRSEIALLNSRAAKANADPKDLAKAIEIGFGNYQSCSEEYSVMAKEYADTADQLNGLIGACSIGR